MRQGVNLAILGQIVKAFCSDLGGSAFKVLDYVLERVKWALKLTFLAVGVLVGLTIIVLSAVWLPLAIGLVLWRIW